jgi:hypothetical protein
MGDTGLTITTGSDMTRIQVSCEHQNGLIYVVPAERSWVCSIEFLPAHALAGFFRELAALQLPVVRDLMKQWGIYYRSLPRGGREAAPLGDDPAP